MKLLYLTTWNFSNENADGVCKKINSQIKVFCDKGITVDLIYINEDSIFYRKDGMIECIGSVGEVKKTPAYMKMFKSIENAQYDYVYNRFGMFDTFYYRVLRRLKKNGAKIIMELPTYPYDGERNPGFLNWLMFKWDALYVNKAPKVIDRIVTFFDTDEDIWGIKTYRIYNGIDVEGIRPVEPQEAYSDAIECIAVAMFQNYHGYDRLIQGLADYYNNGGTRKVYLNLIGGGPEFNTYRELVVANKLEECINMPGPMSGDKLDEIYDRCDLAISSLGMYRIGLMDKASSLKTREYMAKGLPIVAGNEMDITAGEAFPYFKLVPNDDTPIDISDIIKFYDEISRVDKQEVISYMRQYAERTCDWKSTLRPILEYMNV